MNPLLASVVGALLTAITALGWGRLLLRVGGVLQSGIAMQTAALLVGFPILSLLLFLMAAAQVISVASCAALSVIGFLLALWSPPANGEADSMAQPDAREPAVHALAGFVAIAGMLAFVALYLRFALAPDDGFDSVYYHLGFVRRYLEHGGFVFDMPNIYGALSQGAELLYLHAYSVGAESAASLLHLVFLFLASAVAYWLVKEEAGNLPGLCAAWMILATPVLGKVATFAYVDAVVLAVVLGTMWMLELWRRSRKPAWLVCAGLLAGFAYAVKYTAFVILLLAALFVLWQSRRLPAQAIRHLLLLGAAASLLVLPWMLRNAVVYENPFAPFFNQYFPNPHFSWFEEEGYRAKLRTYDWLQSWRQLPRELLLGGTHLQGIIGFGFLAAPLALLAAGHRLGRWALLGAALFAAIYPSNVGTRFLIPVLGFTALAMAIGLRRYPLLLAAVALLHAVTAWPPVLHRLVDQGAWVLEESPRWTEAIDPAARQAFLERRNTEFRMARMLDAVTQREPGRVFAYSAIAEGYSRNQVCLDFTSTHCKVAGETLLAGTIPGRMPAFIQSLQFPRTAAQAVRLVLANGGGEERWTFHELRLWDGDREIERSREWRLRASDEPWRLPEAFDNSPASAWSAWKRARPGQWVQVELGAARSLDRVTLRMAPDWSFARYQLQLLDPQGVWRDVPHRHEEHTEAGDQLPREAALALYRQGFRYVIAYTTDFHFSWLMRDKDRMGLEVAAASEDGAIFRILP